MCRSITSLLYGVPAPELAGAVADVATAQDAVEAGAVGKALVVPGAFSLTAGPEGSAKRPAPAPAVAGSPP